MSKNKGKKNIKVDQVKPQVSAPQQQGINLDETDSETIGLLKDQQYQLMQQAQNNILAMNKVLEQRRQQKLAAKLQQEKNNVPAGSVSTT